MEVELNTSMMVVHLLKIWLNRGGFFLFTWRNLASFSPEDKKNQKSSQNEFQVLYTHNKLVSFAKFINFCGRRVLDGE